MEVEKQSIIGLVVLFVLYVITHLIIGVYQKKIEEQLASKPGNQKIERQSKILNFLFKWYPAIYVVFVIAILSI